jgi:putative membrane protein
MTHRWTLLVAAISTVGLAFLGAGTASAAAPSSQDTTFMAATAQTDLAEITIGQIALNRSTNTTIRDLANKTISDHQTAQGKLEALAKTLDVTLPTTPNATQQSQAAQLRAVAASSFDVTYAQIQVSGHELAVASTKQEISAGSDPSVVALANTLLPIITGHLTMSQQALAAVGGTPVQVPAGSGGLAATSSSTPWISIALLTLGVILVVLGTVVTVMRLARRRVNTP